MADRRAASVKIGKKLVPFDLWASALGMIKLFGGQEAERVALSHAEKSAAKFDRKERRDWLVIASTIRIASRTTSIQTFH